MKPYDQALLTRIANGEKRISVCHLTLADGVTKYYFLKSAPGNPDAINGNDYQKRLIKMGGLKESPFTSETNRQEIEWSNVNSDGSAGEFGLLTADELRPLKMAKVETFEYFPSDNSFLYYYDGYLSQPQATEQKVRATVVDAAIAAGFVFATTTISARNGFVNPDPEEQVPPSGGTGTPIGGGEINPIDPCFIKGTLIYEDFGKLKPNDEFEKGDVILTFNPETLEAEKGAVTEVIQKTVDDLLEITFANKKVLRVTKNHKFYTEHKIWTPIKQISIGTKIYDFASGKAELVKLVSTQWINEQAEVINFECEPNPTYLPLGLAAHNNKDPHLPGTAVGVQV